MNDPRPNKAKEPKDKAPRYKNPLSKGKYRNDPCVCGSGKKVKKCHGVKHALSKSELDETIDMINNFNKRFQEALGKNAKEELEKLSKGELSGNYQQSE